MNADRQVAICTPEWIQPQVHSYQRRCAECPVRVWVSAVMLESAEAEGIRPVCVFCARDLIARNEVAPVFAMTQAQTNLFASAGLLPLAEETMATLNESRGSLLRHVDELAWMCRR